jgi:Flp pilus assembly protein TadG
MRVQMTSLFNRWRLAAGRPVQATRSESGASVVEIALLSPLLILILFGMLDLARWVYLAIEVSDAARAGAQYGAQNFVTAADSTGIATAATNDVPYITGLTVQSSAPSGGLTQECWCSSAPGTNVSCTLSSCSGSSQLILLLQVNTSMTYTPWFMYLPFNKTFTVSGKAIMPVGE